MVIARGSDGRRHFPAAVAGQIYRELGSRFGTPINVQLATAPADGSTDTKAAELNEEEKDADDAEAAELESAEQEAEAQEAKGTTATTTTSPAAPVSQPRKSNVKQVLKTIERHNPEPQKTNKSTTTPSTKPTTATQPDARARRVNP